MKLNLGCGPDIKPGYVNVDFRKTHESVFQVDLSKFPWPWEDDSAEEILMLDFLEHFPYAATNKMLLEAHRVLKLKGKIIIQVPDLNQCSNAACCKDVFTCNRCGFMFDLNYKSDLERMLSDHSNCGNCKQPILDISRAAVARLYGGQDYEGNYHYNAFSFDLLADLLIQNGFGSVKDHSQELNENSETYYQNWNIKVSAIKGELEWK